MYDGEMNDEHIWLKAYCALLTTMPPRSAKKYADTAVEDFHERFDAPKETPVEKK